MNQDELLFFEGHPGALGLYEGIRDKILDTFDEVAIQVDKTQISFRRRYGFAYVWLPPRRMQGRPEVYILLSIGLNRRLESRRFEQVVEVRPGRWMHPLPVDAPGDVDAEVMGWLEAAWAFAGQPRRRGRGMHGRV